MTRNVRALADSPFGIPIQHSYFQTVMLRYARFALFGLLEALAVFVQAGRAHAQNIPAVPNPTCDDSIPGNCNHH